MYMYVCIHFPLLLMCPSQHQIAGVGGDATPTYCDINHNAHILYYVGRIVATTLFVFHVDYDASKYQTYHSTINFQLELIIQCSWIINSGAVCTFPPSFDADVLELARF